MVLGEILKATAIFSHQASNPRPQDFDGARRKGFFEPDLYAALLRHIPDYLKPLIRAAYITGWQIQSEILTCQKHHLDLDGGWLGPEPGEGNNAIYFCVSFSAASPVPSPARPPTKRGPQTFQKFRV